MASDDIAWVPAVLSGSGVSRQVSFRQCFPKLQGCSRLFWALLQPLLLPVLQFFLYC